MCPNVTNTPSKYRQTASNKVLPCRRTRFLIAMHFLWSLSTGNTEMVDIWDTCSGRKCSTSRCCVYFSQDSWRIEWKPLHKSPTPSTLTRLLLLPFAPLAASFALTASSPFLPFNSWHGDKKREEIWSLEGGGSWWRNFLEKESVSVAPTESVEGAVGAEMGLLVRGYSWKVCRSHWAGTVDDKGQARSDEELPVEWSVREGSGLGGFVCVCAPRMLMCVYLCESCPYLEFVSVSAGPAQSGILCVVFRSGGLSPCVFVCVYVS